MEGQERQHGRAESEREPARRTPSRVGSEAPGRVTLVRGRHTWRFEFGAEDRAALLTALDELASRSECPFDAFDAALVGHEAVHGPDQRTEDGDRREAA